MIGEHAGSRVTGNDIGGSAGELVQKIHPLMQDTVTGTQKDKGNQSSSYLAPAPMSIHGGWGRTRAYEARQRSLVQSCLVFWTIGSHYRLLQEGFIFWKDLLFQHVFERSIKNSGNQVFKPFLLENLNYYLFKKGSSQYPFMNFFKQIIIKDSKLG